MGFLHRFADNVHFLPKPSSSPYMFNGAFMTEWNAEDFHAFKFHSSRTIKWDMKVFLQDQRLEDDFSDKDRFPKLSFGSS